MSKKHLSESKPKKLKLQDINFEINFRTPGNLILGILSFTAIIPIIVISVPIFVFIVSQGGCIERIIAYLIPFAVISASVNLYRLSKRYLHNPARLLNDSRPPVLYLRTFGSQSAEVEQRLNKKTPEEMLASTFNRIGPFIAVGKPGEEGLPLLGATRLYINTDWKAEVEKLMSIAEFVIINADDTESILWEIEKSKELVAPHKLIFSFMTRHEFGGLEPFYHRFAKSFTKIFNHPLPEFNEDICFLYFHSDWSPHPILIPKTKPGCINLRRNFFLNTEDFISQASIDRPFFSLFKHLKLM
ncbi:MAG: hypothetical protein LUM44_17175 [Pyrinomonadaceae bacterium]|nr:hypothetical protein [Pyrinomonadaceae bacterium]